MNEEKHPLADTSIDPYVKAAFAGKAEDVVVLKVQDLTSIADLFIICSGRSNRQVSAIAERIEMDLKERAIKPLGIEGKEEGQWVLLDYGHVIFHVFYGPIRGLFDLEGLWIEAERMETNGLDPLIEDSIADH